MVLTSGRIGHTLGRTIAAMARRLVALTRVSCNLQNELYAAESDNGDSLAPGGGSE